jgi:hypothetical protein
MSIVPTPPPSIGSLAALINENAETLKAEWTRTSRRSDVALPTLKNHLMTVQGLAILFAWLLEPEPSEIEMAHHFGITTTTLRRNCVRLVGRTPPQLDVAALPDVIRLIETEVFGWLLKPVDRTPGTANSVHK